MNKRPTLALAALLVIASASFISGAKTVVVTAQKRQIVYVCPMDKDVKSKTPGKCPKCGMTLKEANEADLKAPPSAETEKRDGPVTSMKIPDVTVYDQDGKQLHFYSDLVRGKTVAINFIFTTCTTICPPLTATFRKVQQELGNDGGRDVRLISVSVDPANDVPERLKAFAAAFGAEPGWSFVTGNKLDIDRLLKALGAFVGDKNDHTPMILVGNEKAGYWTRTYGLAAPATLIRIINEAADKTAAEPAEPASSNQSAKAKTPADVAAEYFPDMELLTQENKPVHFFDDLLKGKTVLVNFAFTTCTGVCPPMTANLAKVQTLLGDRVGRDINMITISVDPVTDTPDEMKKFAQKFNVKPGWYFLTGRKELVDQLAYKLGGYVEDKNQHTNILIIGNVETGEWAKVFAMSPPDQIVAEVKKISPDR